MKILNKVKITHILSLGIIICSLGSCYPDSKDLTIDDLDVALSFYDDQTNFDNFTTYSMPDSVVVLDELSNQTGTGKFDDQILASVRSNIEALGYQEEADPENNAPDVLVLVSKVINNNVEASPTVIPMEGVTFE